MDEVDHQVQFIANRLAGAFNSRQVMASALTTKAQLESREPTLIAQFDRLGGDGPWPSEP